MIKTEKILIKKTNSLWKTLDNLCFLSKNLYNAANYIIRQNYILNKSYTNYYSLNRILVKANNPDYRALPAKVSQDILRKLDKNWMSFFALLKTPGCIAKIPKYKDRGLEGRNIVIYDKQAISKKRYSENILHLYRTNFNIPINTRRVTWDSLKEVTISHHGSHIYINLVYEAPTRNISILDNPKNCASIDLGVDNLVSMTSNTKMVPIIIKGTPVKNINQYWNKEKSYYQSISKTLNHRYSTKRIERMTIKRENKIKDYFHKTTRFIVNYLVSNNIDTLVLGYNKAWKQNTNLGKTNNQNFVQIPFYKFKEILKYKCEEAGIRFITNEESYTSKCSFLDNESIEKHDSYLGKRVRRGLFRTAGGKLINADINGSLNILKKAVPGAFSQGIVGVVVHPVIIKIAK
jgi:putative transposase